MIGFPKNAFGMGLSEGDWPKGISMNAMKAVGKTMVNHQILE